MHKVISETSVLYQDDVVDYLVKTKNENLLKTNADGNVVLGTKLLSGFKKLTPESVVWVKSDFYWRTRVDEDEPTRDARG